MKGFDWKSLSCDAAAGRYTHTFYAHQSAFHSLPATANSANSAILRRRLNKPAGVFRPLALFFFHVFALDLTHVPRLVQKWG